MGKRWFLICVFVALFGAPAFARGTGGSMGGGSWGGGGGGGGGGFGGGGGGGGFGGGGGGGFGGGGGGGSYGYHSGGWSSGSSNDLGAMLVPVLLVGAVFLVIAIFKGQSSSIPNDLSFDYDSAPAPGTVDVSVLRIVVDGRARKFVQSELARIAQVADTKTTEGRQTMLREVALMLRRLRDAWVYGGAVNEPMRDMGGAKASFDGHVDDERSRFKEETIRNEQGTVTRGTPSSYTPHSDEGAGLILVSIIIAARRELFTVSRIGNGDDLRHALESASQIAVQELVAIEIVWQPSEDADRLSSMELEAKYPRPDLIPITGALVGKTFCTYCGGPFPAELVSCPHCGAPAPGRDAPQPAPASPAKAA